jgi:hypothetical protein
MIPVTELHILEGSRRDRKSTAGYTPTGETLQKDRLKKLAESIDALVRKDEEQLRRTQQMLLLRRQAASQLHSVCAEFARALNQLTSQTELKLDPPDFNPESFRDSDVNLFQLNARGRILQIEFEATEELTSSEDFRIPYALHGAVRGFNQELLEQNLVREQLLFYTVEKTGSMWRFFDARTYRTGAFDLDYLIGLLEQLV